VPKLLSSEEIVAILSANGFEFVSQRGSHRKYRNLNKLQEMEYLLPPHGGRGQSFVYELLFDGDDDGRPQMCGLIDTATIRTSSMNATTSSPQRAPNEPTSRNPSLVAEAPVKADFGTIQPRKSENAENAQGGKNRRVLERSCRLES